MSNMKQNTFPHDVATVTVSPVVQQHYWQCSITLEYDGIHWSLQITDVFAVNRWQDADDTCRKVLPASFPAMTADRLAAFINAIPPCGPGYGGYRNVSAKEVQPLIEAARHSS